MIMRIENINAPELDVYARLTEAQIKHPQKGEGMFIAESAVVIERALEAGFEPVSFLMEEKNIEGSGKQLLERCGEIPVYTAPIDVLEKITGYRLTRGILCAMKRKPLPNPAELAENSKRVAVLQNIENPTNVGAIFRSAAALGLDAVFVTEDCSDPLYRRSVRVSMGTVFQIPWAVIGSAGDMKKYGFRTAALALRENSISIKDPSLKSCEKLALILGTEGTGLPDDIIDGCDFTVKIPMYHGVDSLNVAAASAVAFWQISGADL